MNDQSVPAPPAVPGGLTGDMENIWRATARPDHTDGDRALLKLYVRWVAFADQMLTLAAADPTDLGKANAATTATTNCLRLAEALGVGPSGRKSLDIAAPRPKPVTGRPKRTLDELAQILRDAPPQRINGGEPFKPTTTAEDTRAAGERAAKGGK